MPAPEFPSVPKKSPLKTPTKFMGLPDVPKFVPGLVRLPRKYPGASIPGEMLAAVKLVSPAPPPVNELLAFEKVLIPVHVFAPDHDGRPVRFAPLNVGEV